MAYVPNTSEIILYLREDLRANIFEGFNNPKNIPTFFSFSDKSINYQNNLIKNNLNVPDISGDGLDCTFSLSVNTTHIPTFIRPITPSIFQNFETNDSFITVLDGRFPQRTDSISLGEGMYSYTAQTNTLGTFLAEYTFNLPRDYNNELIVFNFLYSKINFSSATWNNRLSTENTDEWAIINGSLFSSFSISGSVESTSPIYNGRVGARVTGKVGQNLKIIIEDTSGVQGTILLDDFKLEGINITSASDDESGQYTYIY